MTSPFFRFCKLKEATHFLESKAEAAYLVYTMLWIEFYKYKYGCIFGMIHMSEYYGYGLSMYVIACFRITLPNFS